VQFVNLLNLLIY